MNFQVASENQRTPFRLLRSTVCGAIVYPLKYSSAHTRYSSVLTHQILDTKLGGWEDKKCPAILSETIRRFTQIAQEPFWPCTLSIWHAKARREFLVISNGLRICPVEFPFNACLDMNHVGVVKSYLKMLLLE